MRRWELGYKCIVGQRKKSDENFIMYRLRRLYYKIIDTLSDSKQIEMINGFGLYDRAFLDILKQIEETKPFFKTVLSEYGINMCIIQYEQAVSNRGKSNFNFLKNYDFAMHGITSSTKLLMRLATFISVLVGIICMGLSLYVFIRKILYWDTYPLGSASIMVGVFFLGAVQLFFIGVLGEYILSINERVGKKPRIIIEKTINMEEKEVFSNGDRDTEIQKKNSYYIFGGLFLAISLLLFYSFIYNDILETMRVGISFWDDLFSGNVKYFYAGRWEMTPFAYNKVVQAVYDFPIYIIFAIWICLCGV